MANHVYATSDFSRLKNAIGWTRWGTDETRARPRDQYCARAVLYVRPKNSSDITVATCCGLMRRENPKGTLKFRLHTLRLIPRLMLLRRRPAPRIFVFVLTLNSRRGGRKGARLVESTRLGEDVT